MSAGDSRYSPRVRSLFAELPNAGPLPVAAGRIAAGESIALDRGAWVRFEARCEDGRIAECRFRAWGCPHALAASALAASRLSGASLELARAIDAAGLARELDAPAGKLGRLLVVEDAIHSLIAAIARLQ
ncbi:MAG: iron-sulfur cluster assembly scaffold protein [Steroidobacteraceae bacterium]